MRALPLLALLAMGCPKSTPSASEGAALARLAPVPSVVEYDLHTVAGPFNLPVTQHREEWHAVSAPAGQRVYDVEVWDVTEGARDPVETVRRFYNDAGYGFIGTVDGDGDLDTWEPAQVVLPAVPRVGDTWTNTHTKAGRTSERTCELQAADHCTGGVVSVCESRREHGVVILRDHFCPGEGWVGFEALQQVGGQPAVRMWSEAVVRDGVALTPIPVQPDE